VETPASPPAAEAPMRRPAMLLLFGSMLFGVGAEVWRRWRRR
jgi:hypothetical protein